MATSKEPHPTDHAAELKTLLSRLEKVIAQRDLLIRMSRELWRDIGFTLSAQRKLMSSDKEYGNWKKRNGFDKGRLSDPSTLSNARWLAEQWDLGLEYFKPELNHPTSIRMAWREIYERRRPKHPKKRERKTAYLRVDPILNERINTAIKNIMPVGTIRSMLLSAVDTEFIRFEEEQQEDKDVDDRVCTSGLSLVP